jgi:hypothetical protein
MRRGIHRGWEADQDKRPRRAWISDAPGSAGEWGTEAEYRAAGYSPNFDSLPVKIVQRIPVPDDFWDTMPEADKRYIDEYLENKLGKPKS